MLKDAAGKCHYMDFAIAKMATANSVVATPNAPRDFNLSAIIDGKNVFYTLPYEKSPYLLVSKGNVLYYINRDNVGHEDLIYYCTFNEDITAIDAEVYNSERVGVGLSNGEFHIMDFSVAALKAEEKKRYLYSSKDQTGKIVDIRYKAKTSNGWPR